jgi:hypothetical protein
MRKINLPPGQMTMRAGRTGGSGLVVVVVGLGLRL